MMLKLTPSEGFTYPVKFSRIRDDGGKTTHQVLLTFKRLDVDGLRERQLQGGAQLFNDLMVQLDGDRERVLEAFTVERIKQGKGVLGSEEMADDLLEIVMDWRDVTDDNGILPFNRDNLIKLIRFSPTVYPAIIAAFDEIHSPKGAQGN